MESSGSAVHRALYNYPRMRPTEIFPLRGEAHHPWHLYIAVVLCNADGKIAIVKDPDGSYLLPRETVSSDDSLVPAIHRLVLEQVGVVPHVRWYLGALTVPFTRYDGAQTEKTVLYFEALAESRYANAESDSDTKRWLSPEDAKALLLEQPHGEGEILDRLRTTAS